MKIAIVDKNPSRNNYAEYFDFEFDLYHLSSVPVQKLLKKDVDIDIDTDMYDLVILVGSEAAKFFAKITSITTMAGQLVNGKYVAMPNPAMLLFKPEGKLDFERAVDKIKSYISKGIVAFKENGDYKGIFTEEEAKIELLEALNSPSPIVALDTEDTALYPRDGHVLGISISHKLKKGRYIIADVLNDENTEILQRILNTKEIVFHNLKFDYKMTEYHLGVKYRDDHLHDTMLLHYVLDENSSHGLKELALKYTDFGDYDAELRQFIDDYCRQHGVLKDDFQWEFIPPDIISKYASKDSAVTLELFEYFWPIVQKNPKLLYVYKELLLKGTLFLHRMEEVGIPINKERMQAAERYLDKSIQEAKQQIYSFPEVRKFEEDNGVIFNPNSVQQLRKVLFDYAGLTPTGKLTDTGATSTDAEVLEELSEEHPLPAHLLKTRQLGKIKNTYVSKILREIDRDGRIRTNFNLIFTTSGRLSSSGKFNAQQIPRDDPIIKGCIYAPDGYVIVSQDLQTAEMYFASVLSKDQNLQEVFRSGGDFHSTIAKMVFDLPCEVEKVKELYSAMRQSAKAISFGILYGASANKVAETVSKATGMHYSLDSAQDDIDAYFTKFSKLKKWLKERERFIKENGYTYSFFGRKRRLLNVFSVDKGIAAHEVRSGINSEIQSIASDVNLLGAMDTYNELKQKKLPADIFMLVHDSIVGLVREDCVEEYKEILRRNTQKDRGCSIPGSPIGVDQEVGKDYSFGKFDKYYKLESGILSRV